MCILWPRRGVSLMYKRSRRAEPSAEPAHVHRRREMVFGGLLLVVVAGLEDHEVIVLGAVRRVGARR